MSFYFRDKPRFSDRLRGKSGDELLQEIKQQFDEDSKSFFEPSTRSSRDPFERHGFSKGFPFDDDGFGRRTDIRTHLDALAAKHPEFADHLVGPPWADIPFHGSLRNRRRGSGNGSNNSYQGHPDEDATSQASGSSAASAASGASGVSSHGEPENGTQSQQDFGRETRSNPIPNYGLRNTVDIGQHHHNMENFDKDNRGQRSMSAPPENRQNCQEQLSQQPQQGQRFVSRVDITPQHNQPQQQQQKEQKSQQQSNVRHIPIFVEGRDEPVIPKNVVDAPFRRSPSPTQFRQSPPHHFPRSSPFGSSPFGTRQHAWPPQFQDFYPQPEATFEQPMRRQQYVPKQSRQQQREQQFYEQQPRPQQQFYDQQPRHQQQFYEQQPRQQQPKQQQKPHSQPQQQEPQQQQQQQQPQSEPPKPKPTLPKDALERVALVQKEVDSLAEQVRQYSGNSRKDKEYIYLDEMLTRELIKLDDIETEGKENVRQARKNAIRTIQETISLLESKAPLPASQQQSVDEQETQTEQQTNNTTDEGTQHEPMEVDQKEDESTVPIPLPPGPSSPTKKPEEENKDVSTVEDKETLSGAAEQTQESQQQATVADNSSSNPQAKPMESCPSENTDATTTNIQLSSEIAGSNEVAVESKKEETLEEKNIISEDNQPKNISEPTGDTDKMEVDASTNSSKKPTNTPKKGKKQKKQIPVSEQPIPLPPPENTETSAK